MALEIPLPAKPLGPWGGPDLPIVKIWRALSRAELAVQNQEYCSLPGVQEPPPLHPRSEVAFVAFRALCGSPPGAQLTSLLWLTFLQTLDLPGLEHMAEGRPSPAQQVRVAHRGEPCPQASCTLVL